MGACWLQIIVSLFFFLKTDMIIYTLFHASAIKIENEAQRTLFHAGVDVTYHYNNYVNSYVLKYVRLLMSI